MEDVANRVIDQSSYMMTARSNQFINSFTQQINDYSMESNDNLNENYTIDVNGTTNKDNGSGEWMYGQIFQFMFMMLSMLFSTLIATMISTLIPALMRTSRNFTSKINRFTHWIGCTKPLYEVLLTSTISMSDYGKESVTITPQKIAVLHYLRKHQNEYKELYKLREKDNGKYTYDFEVEERNWNNNSYYEINQDRPVIIYKNGRNYIKIICQNDFIENEQNEKRRRNSTISTQQYNLYIRCNYGLQPIHDFMNKCTKELEEDKNKDARRYMFTYLGLNSQKKPMYEKHEFRPYAHFNGLVGKIPKYVKRDFAFFESDEGEAWYKKRNLPYQLTHCYYGDPGTGKSVIACAVANEHNLHIVRIRLSDIKDNQEFVKVLRNTKYDGHTLEYRDVLYMFDEFDTELEKLTKNSTQDLDSTKILKRHKSYSNSSKNDSSCDDEDDCDDCDDEDDEDDCDKDNKNVKTKSENDFNNLIEDMKDADDNEFDRESLIKKLTKMKTYMFKTHHDSNLSIGVILEELNGINQMYGRKMIIITNKIEMLSSIHKGAFVRPGRIDRMCELVRMTRQDIIDMIHLFYDDTMDEKYTVVHYLDNLNPTELRMLRDDLYTPAFITNICKISRTIDDFFVNLRKYR
jgi:hypothetical protein